MPLWVLPGFNDQLCHAGAHDQHIKRVPACVDCHNNVLRRGFKLSRALGAGLYGDNCCGFAVGCTKTKPGQWLCGGCTGYALSANARIRVSVLVSSVQVRGSDSGVLGFRGLGFRDLKDEVSAPFPVAQ